MQYSNGGALTPSKFFRRSNPRPKLMNKKITLEDLIGTEGDACKQRFRDEKSLIYEMNKEEIRNHISTKKSDTKQKKSAFFEITPTSDLEKAINETLKSKPIDYAQKRREREFMHDFERKMRRIKKIKSKTYRKIRRREKAKIDAELKSREEGLVEHPAIEEGDTFNKSSIPEKLLRQAEGEEGKGKPLNHILSFDGKEDSDSSDDQLELVKKAFDIDNNKDEVDEEFDEEKRKVIEEDLPKVEETVLPGWGGWYGPGLEIQKTKVNTLKRKIEGVKYSNRKDFGARNVIVNENTPSIDDKYKVSLPYGHTSEEYRAKLDVPVSKEWNTLRIFNKFVKPKGEPAGGDIIEPFYYNPKY
jgi:U3 small nucleolar RNA-associated protein 14